MAILQVLTEPDPRLRLKALPFETFNDEAKRVLRDLEDTMNHLNGLGLAATQVGILKRALVMVMPAENVDDGSLDFDDTVTYRMINPVITFMSPETAEREEYCFSVPKEGVNVTRPVKVKVRYIDENGAEKAVDCEGLLARCVQHEIDHLDGKLTIDYLSAIRKEIMIRKLAKKKKAVQRELAPA